MVAGVVPATLVAAADGGARGGSGIEGEGVQERVLEDRRLTRSTAVQTERDEVAGRRGDGAWTAAAGVGRDGPIPSVRRLPTGRAWSSRGRRSRRSPWRRRMALGRSEASARCGGRGERRRTTVLG